MRRDQKRKKKQKQVQFAIMTWYIWMRNKVSVVRALIQLFGIAPNLTFGSNEQLLIHANAEQCLE